MSRSTIHTSKVQSTEVRFSLIYTAGQAYFKGELRTHDTGWNVLGSNAERIRVHWVGSKE